MVEDDAVNEITGDLRTIFNKHIHEVSNERSKNNLKVNLVEYLVSVSEIMGYVNLPEIEVELQGPFITVNFLDDKKERIETIGDLVYYMDTGLNLRKEE